MKESIRQQVNNIKEHYDEIKAGHNTAFMLMNPRVLEEWHKLNTYIHLYYAKRHNPDIEELLFECWLHRNYTVKKYYYDKIICEQIYDFRVSSCPPVLFEYYDDYQLPDFFSLYQYTENLDCHSVIDNFIQETEHSVMMTTYRVFDNEANKMLEHANGFIKCMSRLYDDFRFITSYDTVLKSKLATEEQIACALNDGYHHYSKDNYDETLRALKREKQTIEESNIPRLNDDAAWKEVWYKEREIYELAWSKKLKDSDDSVLSFFDETMRVTMENNKLLVNTIKQNAFDDELFDVNYCLQKGVLLDRLDDENLNLFYYLILRHNIIVGEMNGELKKSFSEWLSKEPDTKKNEMSDVDRCLLDCIMGYVRKVDWQGKASCEKATEFFEDIFTNEQEFRDFFKNVRAGKGNVKNEVAMANIIGHLMRFGLIGGGQTEISKSVFGKDMSGNINRTYRDNGKPSQAFLKLKPILEEYRKKYF